MAISVLLPKLSFVVTEGTIIEWLKKPGDSVSKGEPLLVIETEKATEDIEAPGTGILGPEIAPKGITVPVTTVIGYLLEKGEISPKLDLPIGKSTAPANDQGVADVKEQPQEKLGEAQKVSPLAKRLAKEHNIDLTKIKGTGPGGRILQEDIQPYIGTIASSTKQIQAVVSISTSPTSSDIPSPVKDDELHGEFHELSNLQRITAERMALSFRSSPHFYLNVQVDMSQAVIWREAMLQESETQTGSRLSFTDIFIYTVSRVLKIHPAMNAVFENEKLFRYTDINLSMAVDTPRGLTAPVVRQADQLPLFEITRKRAALVERAQNNRLSLDELNGGTFTISNLGMFGIDVFNAIINPSQAAILAIGRITKRPIVINDTLELRPTMWLSLSVDHRAADGAVGARFLQDLVNYLENPYRILMKQN
jgi:pyruvate dehydrogenase E2 component (dihydrolipoamide acetyltransferase)